MKACGCVAEDLKGKHYSTRMGSLCKALGFEYVGRPTVSLEVPGREGTITLKMKSREYRVTREAFYGLPQMEGDQNHSEDDQEQGGDTIQLEGTDDEVPF